MIGEMGYGDFGVVDEGIDKGFVGLIIVDIFNSRWFCGLC